MTLGELKKSIARLPPDMNDMHVVIIYAHDGKPQLDLLAFTGYIPTRGTECIAMGTISEVKRRVKSGEMAPPDGYSDIEDSI